MRLNLRLLQGYPIDIYPPETVLGCRGLAELWLKMPLASSNQRRWLYLIEKEDIPVCLGNNLIVPYNWCYKKHQCFVICLPSDLGLYARTWTSLGCWGFVLE